MVAAATTASLQAHPIDANQARLRAAQLLGGTLTLRKAAPQRPGGSTSAPYYIFSRGEGQGYVIAAGDDCLPAIIGYTEIGDFDERKEAPQLLAMLDGYARAVATLQAEGRNVPQAPPAPPAKARSNIAPLLTSHWHQSAPYNNRVPKLADGNRALTGCVATAGAQVFYFWRKDLPRTLPATTPTYDYGDAPAWPEYQLKKGTPLQWELMLDSYGSQPAEYHDAVAVLMAAVGMQTYLTYGASTGGFIWDLPFEMYNLGSKRADKDNGYDDATWSALIYSDLAKGHPVVYSGYKEDMEGHAVVIDGYRAAGDFFHFNYGWGGQSDGYYTVKSIADGGMEFGMQPTVMYGIQPLVQRLDIDVELPKTVYADRANDVALRITSHSSLPAKGFYLFANTTGRQPQRLADAFAADTESEVPVDATAHLHFTGFKPTAAQTWHLFVTDDQLHVLATRTVEAVTATTALTADSLRIEGTTAIETHGGTDYTVVYNSRATASALVRNEGDAHYQGTAQAMVYTSVDEGATWQLLGRKAGKMDIAAHATQRVPFAITSSSATPIRQGQLYRIALAAPLVGSDDTLQLAEATDTVAYFVVRTADLKAVAFDDPTLRLEGHWDPAAFANIAKKAGYATALNYDLTAVEGVDFTAPAEVAPYALYYVGTDARVSGDNAVKGDNCARLAVAAVHDFAPWADFDAQQATFCFEGVAGAWQVRTVPFDAPVPDGLAARAIGIHDAEAIATTDVEYLEAGQTYLMMPSHTGTTTIVATDTHVAAMPTADATQAVGTYRQAAMPADALTVDGSGMYLVAAEEGAPLMAMDGYLPANGATRRLSLQTGALDPAYFALALAIDEARRTLQRYRDVVGEGAYERFHDAIAEAEHEFAHREGSALNTVAKITAYADQLAASGEEYMHQVTDVGNIEVDFTGLIRNPSFETKNTAGWTLTTPLNTSVAATTAAGVYPISNLNYFTVGGEGSYVLNNTYNHLLEGGGFERLGVGISQQVDGLVPGHYRLTVGVGSDEGGKVTVFAGEQSATVVADAFGKHYLVDAVVDDIVVEADGDGMATLTIGIAPGGWYRADHFRLVYTGSPDETPHHDGIDMPTVRPRTSPRGIYTLQGTRLARITQPGIYIVDGKKVAVRQPAAEPYRQLP